MLLQLLMLLFTSV